MEIQVNNTATTDDDYVPIKCDHPAGRRKVPCQIRVSSPAAQGTTVVLSNPDGRLRFPQAANTSTTLVVPADGSRAPFEISGERGSNALNDAVIEAHCQSAAGPQAARKTVTVFWFDEARITLTPGGTYAITGGQYTITGANAVSHSVQAKIKPAGANCAAPQIAPLRVGIMQNDVTRGLGSEIVWGTPTIAWAPGVAAGTVVNVPSAFHRTSSLPTAANDVAPTVAPL